MQQIQKNMALTPRTLDDEEEEWEVYCGKQVYTLTKKQKDYLKTKDLEGHRGLIWFDEFAISVPHISSIEFARRYKKSEKVMSEYVEVLDENGKVTHFALKTAPIS